LKETGRYSNTPLFVVGIYLGDVKLGEGWGGSLKMAEYRVCTSLHIQNVISYLFIFRQQRMHCIGFT
jgi:dsRNA-specific ribonuclease